MLLQGVQAEALEHHPELEGAASLRQEDVEVLEVDEFVSVDIYKSAHVLKLEPGDHNVPVLGPHELEVLSAPQVQSSVERG